MEGEDAYEIKQLTDVLTHASHKLAASVYQQDAGGSIEPHHVYDPGSKTQNASHVSDEDVVDADYQEVA